MRLRHPQTDDGAKRLDAFRIADMLRDAPIVEEAHPVRPKRPDLQNPAYERLKRQVLKRYGEALELGDVG